MSRVLKIIVNVILICAIATAAALLIPSVLDVPMAVVDDVNMDTNLPVGSVTYAREKQASQVEAQDELLISQEGSRYVYEVQSVNGETCTVVDNRSGDGTTQEITIPSVVDEVVITIPFIGYASMALRSTEGLIIVGLAVVFVIILLFWQRSGKKMRMTMRKMMVRETRRVLRAISLGVFFREAPSTRAIIRSRKLLPGSEVIRIFSQSDTTVVPPVTEQKSPPLSRTTGADSPVMADSSTEAMPSMTSPSPGITSPADTITISPFFSSLEETVVSLPS